MKILVAGSSGTIGSAVVAELSRGHEVISVSRSHSKTKADITDAASVRKLFDTVGTIDAIVSVAGAASFAPLAGLGENDFSIGLTSKFMGQVRLVLAGMASVRDGGSITLTSGILSRHPVPGSAAISPVNSALEAFVKATALEIPRKIRINCVCPGWVAETLQAMGGDPKQGIPAAELAKVYRRVVEGTVSGEVIDAVAGPA